MSTFTKEQLASRAAAWSALFGDAPSTRTVFIDKADKSYTIDLLTLPTPSALFFIDYGISQKYGDSAASVKFSSNIDGRKVAFAGKDKVAAILAAVTLVDETHEAFASGNIRRTRTSDPVAAQARRIAITKVSNSPDYKAWLAKSNLKPGDKDATAELAKRAEVLASNPSVIALAESFVASMAALDA